AAKANPEAAAKVLRIAVDVHLGGRTINGLFEKGRDAAKKHADANPRAALAMLDTIQPLAKAEEELHDVRLVAFKSLLTKNPNDLDAASGLALVLESRGDFDGCEKLLAPHAQDLGDREGARILGQIHVNKGKFEEAYALLAPYTEKRLAQLRENEENLKRVVQQVDNDVLAELKQGRAMNFDIRAYRAANKDEQQRMVQDYLDNRLRDDPRFKNAQAALRGQRPVVQAAMDLGVVLLRRAQAEAKPETRKKELERAEKSFLAVRGVVGRDEGVRLGLGEVYYWLGKHAEGKKEFDDLLAAHERKTETVLLVAQTLRR